MATTTDAVTRGREDVAWFRLRRCMHRSCGRYRNKVRERSCDSCGRSTRWAHTAFLTRLKRVFR